MTRFAVFLGDEAGAAAVEYAVILAIIAGSIVAGATLFGGAISAGFSNAIAIAS